MTIEEVENWFGNMNKVCVKLGIAPQNSTKWKLQGYIPWKQQFRIAFWTDGELMPDENDPYPGRFPKSKQLKENRNEMDVI